VGRGEPPTLAGAAAPLLTRAEGFDQRSVGLCWQRPVVHELISEGSRYLRERRAWKVENDIRRSEALEQVD